VKTIANANIPFQNLLMQNVMVPPPEGSISASPTTVANLGGMPVKSQEMDDVLEILIRTGGEKA